MAETTKIEWTDATWNPITGCSIVDAGCTNCYAMALAGSRLRHHPSRAGLTRITGGRAKWTGEVRLNEGWLDQPLRWKRPRMIFVCAHGDLFHESAPDEWIDRVFAVMALAPRHTFQVLTKRPERMREYLACRNLPRSRIMHLVIDRVILEDMPFLLSAAPGMVPSQELIANSGLPVLDLNAWPLPNVWLGTSVSDQASADTRIPHLLATPAAVRFVSAEPLLGLINPAWLEIGRGRSGEVVCAMTGRRGKRRRYPDGGYGPLDWSPAGSEPRLDWIICGGESGPNARPMHPDWARSLRDQCVAAGVAFHFKQWGEYEADQIGPEDARSVNYPPGHVIFRKVGKRAAGRMLDGRTWDELPGAA